MMDTYSVNVGYTVPSVVTGKPVSIGGSLGRSSATFKGVAHIALAALELLGLQAGKCSAAVQGFGKVGAGAAAYLAEAGVRVQAVSDQYGAVVAEEGLDVPALTAHVASTGTVNGFPTGVPFDPSALLEVEVDVLVPAALEGVLTEDNVPGVRSKLIIEGANGPTTAAADQIPNNLGVQVVPDILANAGGVIVSYF